MVCNYPFSDQYEKSKRRPGLIIGTPPGDNLIIMKVSTNQRINSIEVKVEDFEDGRLKSDSFVLFDNIITVHKKNIGKPVAKITKAKYKEVIDSLLDVIS